MPYINPEGYSRPENPKKITLDDLLSINIDTLSVGDLLQIKGQLDYYIDEDLRGPHDNRSIRLYRRYFQNVTGWDLRRGSPLHFFTNEILWDFWSRRDIFIAFRDIQIERYAAGLEWDFSTDGLSMDLDNGPDLQRWIMADFAGYSGDFNALYDRLYPLILPIVKRLRVRSVWLYKREFDGYMRHSMWQALGRWFYNDAHKLRHKCEDAWKARDGQIAIQILKQEILAHHSPPVRGARQWTIQNQEFLANKIEVIKPNGKKDKPRERFILGVEPHL